MPTSRRAYYGTLLWGAFKHGWGRAETVATALGLLIPLFLRLRPELRGRVEDLAWQIPLGVLGALAVTRLVLAPYWMYRELEAANESLTQERNDARRALESQPSPSFPRTIEVRQSVFDRMRQWSERTREQREKDRKLEASRKLAELREAGQALASMLDTSAAWPDPSKDEGDLRARTTEWLENVRATIAEYVSPHKAAYVLSAPFRDAPHGFTKQQLPHFRSSHMLACVSAVLTRLDDVLKDY